MENLNERQKEVVNQIDGPVLVIAGPGSGKTKTMIERVAHILNQKEVEPENILLATFTEKASKELISRISKKIKNTMDISGMYIGTIHSICLRIIDENLEYSFLEKNYKIFDDLEQRFFIYSKIKEFEKIEGYREFILTTESSGAWKKAGEFQKWIDRINEEGLSNKKIVDTTDENIKFLKRLHKRYVELLREENGVDFSNIQLECYRILSENPEVLRKLQEKIKYIMIDEYQDTNKIQEKLFFLIAGDRKNICVVGDDDQGIYRFRGATVRNILEFQKNFKEGECKKVELNINYRSNQDIIEFCEKWMEGTNWDNWRYKKEIISGREDINQCSGVVKISVNGSQRQWNEKIYKFISYLKASRKIDDYNQIAFLFRSFKDSKIKYLVEYLERNGIKVYCPRSGNFFERDEIRFVIGFLLCIFHQGKDYLLEQYYNECYIYARKEIVLDEEAVEYIKDIREKITDMVENENSQEKIGSFLDIFYNLFNFKCFLKYVNLFEEDILQNRTTYNLGIFSDILLKFDILCKIKNINRENLKKVSDYFFNYHLKYLKEIKLHEYESEETPKGAVSFLTIHQAKGLEFPIVIIGSLDNEPHVFDTPQKKLEFEILEEFEPKSKIDIYDFYRLYYTGFSRAKNLLALTCIESQGDYKVPKPIFKKVYDELNDIRSENFKYHRLEIDKIDESKRKDIFSFTSHITLYEKCPLLYNFFRKYKFVEKSTREAIVGVLAHDTLEYINKNLKRNNLITVEEIKEEYYKNYNNILGQNIIKIDEKIISKLLENIIKYFTEYKNITSFIKENEIKISFIRDNYIIEGIADLVLEKDGEIEIIDFKTGRVTQDISSYEAQLRIYAYLIGEKYKKTVKRARLFYINEREDRKLLEIDISQEAITETIKNFDIVTNKILNNYFSYEELKKERCENCFLRKYCEKTL